MFIYPGSEFRVQGSGLNQTPNSELQTNSNHSDRFNLNLDRQEKIRRFALLPHPKWQIINRTAQDNLKNCCVSGSWLG